MLDLLGAAEAGLAALAAEAAAERAYADAAALLDAARRVQQIGEQTPFESDGLSAVSPGSQESGRTTASAKDAPASDSPVPRPRPKKADYPVFFRDGETLVKVAWSKSEGAEYEHKSPRRVLDALVAELARVAGPGKRFVMEKVLPLRDPDTNAEIPTYQPYLALAFLRRAGLVRQHGRSGYSIPKPMSLKADAAVAWNGTATR